MSKEFCPVFTHHPMLVGWDNGSFKVRVPILIYMAKNKNCQVPSTIIMMALVSTNLPSKDEEDVAAMPKSRFLKGIREQILHFDTSSVARKHALWLTVFLFSLDFEISIITKIIFQRRYSHFPPTLIQNPYDARDKDKWCCMRLNCAWQFRLTRNIFCIWKFLIVEQFIFSTTKHGICYYKSVLITTELILISHCSRNGKCISAVDCNWKHYGGFMLS